MTLSSVSSETGCNKSLRRLKTYRPKFSSKMIQDSNNSEVPAVQPKETFPKAELKGVN